VTAPPPARLFPGTAFGTGLWAHVPHGRFMCIRPCRRVAAWLACQGLAVPPGTLADGTGRMLPLSGPIRDAIPARQNEAGLLPAMIILCFCRAHARRDFPSARRDGRG